MIQIVWVFEAQPGRLAEFERAYGVNGDWARLFRKAEGYIETVLLGDSENSDRFLVIDRWRDLASFEAFKRRHQAAYDELDHHCEGITLRETRIGMFNA